MKTLTGMGALAEARSDLAQAEQYYRRSLAIESKLLPDTVTHGQSLYRLAKVLYRQAQLPSAVPLFEQALNTLESHMALFGGTDEDRAAFRDRHSSYYGGYVSLWMDQREMARAFHVIERARAR